MASPHLPALTRHSLIFGLLIGVSVSCGGRGLEPLEWSLVEPPTATSKSLLLSVTESNCRSFVRVDVESRPDAVVLTALGRPAGGSCTAELRGRQVTVELPTPLGDRRLVHG